MIFCWLKKWTYEYESTSNGITNVIDAKEIDSTAKVIFSLPLWNRHLWSTNNKEKEPSVTVENRMFVQVKKKKSLGSSLFEYVIICELGHQIEFPATFTRSHSSAVCMNHFLPARVVCTWWRGKGERQFRYEGSIVFPYSSQSNRLASLVWCLFFLSLKLLNPFYGSSNITINVWCFSLKEWSVLS